MISLMSQGYLEDGVERHSKGRSARIYQRRPQPLAPVTYCDEELYYSRDVIPIKPREGTSTLYLLGIVNSWLITWYHQKRNPNH